MSLPGGIYDGSIPLRTPNIIIISLNIFTIMTWSKTELKKIDEHTTIYFEAMEEHDSIKDSFPEETEESLNEIYRKLDVCHLMWFCAKVYIERNGQEVVSTYLGCCLYENAEDFIENSGYCDDMISEVEEELKEKDEKEKQDIDSILKNKDAKDWTMEILKYYRSK